jgi:hypothetical protein
VTGEAREDVIHSDRRRVICTPAVVPVALIVTWQDPVSADSHHEEPRFEAKVGTSIRLLEVKP